MPFRVARRRRIVRRPRRVVRRRRFVKRVPRVPISQPHNFKQMCELTSITVPTSPSGPVFFAYNFTLSNLPQASTITSLFDQYRIMGVKLIFTPAVINYVPSATTQYQVPEIYTAIDLDSAVIPTTLAQVQEYSTCRRSFLNRPHVRFFKPLASTVTSGSDASVIGTVSLPRRLWYNTFFATTPYFGLIGSINSNNNNLLAPQPIRVTAVYYFQCRNVR